MRGSRKMAKITHTVKLRDDVTSQDEKIKVDLETNDL
jgi:hypothetical protein